MWKCVLCHAEGGEGETHGAIECRDRLKNTMTGLVAIIRLLILIDLLVGALIVWKLL